MDGRGSQRFLLLFIASMSVALWQGAQTVFGGTPGALNGHRFTYADSWTGWPVAPKQRQHPIRGSFLDPRSGGYHFGIDINVRDDMRERGAPRGRSHRVYAIESGYVGKTIDEGVNCVKRRFGVGHFSYWHVDATVRPGQRVRAGQMIGWTCRGQWHVHLAEWTVVRGNRVWVNPLHRGGKIRPYSDTARPLVHEVRFFSVSSVSGRGTEISAGKLHGVVDPRAWASDPQSFIDWWTGVHAVLVADHHPYRLKLTIIRLRDGKRWVAGVFRADQLLPVPFSYHYAPGSYPNVPVWQCKAEKLTDCAGRYWFRLFARSDRAFWDTRTFKDGRYRLKISAFDLKGNRGSKSVDVTIAN